jgi:ribonucleoside-diphosphate reductase beta chain
MEGKTNFFEKRVAEYSKAGVVSNQETNKDIVLDADF